MMKTSIKFYFMVVSYSRFWFIKIRGLVTSCGHKMMQNHKTWNICANTKSKGLKFCRVDVLQELHIVIVVMMSS